jgi:hypothetical protein
MVAKKRTKAKKRHAFSTSKKSLEWWIKHTENNPKLRKELETILRTS